MKGTRELYQRLYDDPALRYGDANFDRCPGVRYLPLFRDWLDGTVVDFGCGRNQLAAKLAREGFSAVGIDWVRGWADIVGDISEPLEPLTYGTATCLDVLEHMDMRGICGTLCNMQMSERQVISVAWFPTREPGHDVELHVTQQPREWWDSFLQHFFVIRETPNIGEQRALYLCARR